MTTEERLEAVEAYVHQLQVQVGELTEETLRQKGEIAELKYFNRYGHIPLPYIDTSTVRTYVESARPDSR